MKLFHRTDNAEGVIAGGFTDAEGEFSSRLLWSGVWFADTPRDGYRRTPPAVDSVAIAVPNEIAIRYEWMDGASHGRDFLMPASVANSYVPAIRANESDEIAAFEERHPSPFYGLILPGGGKSGEVFLSRQFSEADSYTDAYFKAGNLVAHASHQALRSLTTAD